MAVGVVDAAIRAVFSLVYAIDVDAKERVGQITVPETSGIGEEEINKKATEGKEDAEAELPEAGVDIEGGDDAVVVSVPEGDVLLEGGEVGHGGSYRRRGFR